MRQDSVVLSNLLLNNCVMFEGMLGRRHAEVEKGIETIRKAKPPHSNEGLLSILCLFYVLVHKCTQTIIK